MLITTQKSKETNSCTIQKPSLISNKTHEMITTKKKKKNKLNKTHVSY